ncbi:MAG: YHS domain-containing (seleno)protein [Hyphomicrobiaceae bacterium]
MFSRRGVLRFSIAVAASVTIALPMAGVAVDPALAQSSPVFTRGGLAVSGYDPVAYFTDGKPVKGNPAIPFDFAGAKYLFASEANRAAFQKEPAKYAPQYGGYCAWAVAHGAKADADPNAWTIHNGRLFLNLDRSVQKSWVKNLPANIARADANWPKLAGGK